MPRSVERGLQQNDETSHTEPEEDQVAVAAKGIGTKVRICFYTFAYDQSDVIKLPFVPEIMH